MLGGAEWELDFRNLKSRSDLWQQLKMARGTPQLQAFEYARGGTRREQLVIVQMYSGHIKENYLSFWLKRHCQRIEKVEEVLDKLGVWTGACKARAMLKSMPGNPDEVQHLPGPPQGLCLPLGGGRKLCCKCRKQGNLVA